MTPLRRGVAKFVSVPQGEVPSGRKGKHHEIIVRFLNDLEHLGVDRALKVPLAELPDSKANIRSALSRATKVRGIEIETSSDDVYLYVWKTKSSSK